MTGKSDNVGVKGISEIRNETDDFSVQTTFLNALLEDIILREVDGDAPLEPWYSSCPCHVMNTSLNSDVDEVMSLGRWLQCWSSPGLHLDFGIE